MNKILVCYFSASGVTKGVAQNISKALNQDIFEIIPSKKYTKEDLDWTNNDSRSSIEMKDIKSRPSIENKIENINCYDTIVIGFPVWWYTYPRIISTFIEENNLEGKNIYIFVTSGSTSFEGCFSDLKQSYPNLNFISARRFTNKESKEDYVTWVC